MSRRIAAVLAMTAWMWMPLDADAQAVELHAAQFDVTGDSYSSLVGETLVWRFGEEAFTNFFWSTFTWNDSTHFTWAAHPGLRIAGFTVVYDLSFSGGSYLIQGGETGADFGGLQPGETWFSSADFNTSSGEGAHFVGTGEERLLTHEVSGGQFNASYSLVAHGLAEFCVPSSDPYVCSSMPSVATSLQLLSVSVTPTVVAVPEPQSWALFAIGLAVLTAAARKRPRR